MQPGPETGLLPRPTEGDCHAPLGARAPHVAGACSFPSLRLSFFFSLSGSGQRTAVRTTRLKPRLDSSPIGIDIRDWRVKLTRMPRGLYQQVSPIKQAPLLRALAVFLLVYISLLMSLLMPAAGKGKHPKPDLSKDRKSLHLGTITINRINSVIFVLFPTRATEQASSQARSNLERQNLYLALQPPFIKPQRASPSVRPPQRHPIFLP
ncbi:hypothetical protein GE09DRAFT_281552 [Coniochaeta sp. 2T2.1]|nr:hypothetical protein GE09DRAFT_281552 [Coniochaeta sp. 2T2.1]